MTGKTILAVTAVCAALAGCNLTTTSGGADGPPAELSQVGRPRTQNAPYGVCAHLPRHDTDFRNEECANIASLGASTIRFGVSWRGMQKSPDAPLDFAKLDAIVAEAEAHGLTILPILYWPPKWAQPIYEHLDEYAAFIEAVVSHYGARFPAIELWNEENLKGFWGEDPDPAKYALVLKAGYEAAKKAARSTPPGPSGATPLSEGGDTGNQPPSERGVARSAEGSTPRQGAGGVPPAVYFGGTAGVPFDYIRKAYEAGARPFFDAMAVHPYSHPYAPEGDLDKKLESLRALMAEFGDADKPIILTEHGWPTHKATVKGANILLAGLKVARPEQKTWRVAYATTTGTRSSPPVASGDSPLSEGANVSGASPLREGGGPERAGGSTAAATTADCGGIAAAIESILPPGSSCEECNGARLRERLAAGDVDAVVYPFDATFPIDTFDDVCEFVRRGGVLVDIGGAAMWRPMRETPSGLFERLGEDNGKKPLRARLRVEVDAWWLNPALPKEGRAFPTGAAKAAGYKGDPAGERVWRFFTPRLLKEGDEMIPLLTLPLAAKTMGGSSYRSTAAGGPPAPPGGAASGRAAAGDDAPATQDCAVATTNRLDASNLSLVTRHSSLDGGNAAVAACVLRFNSDFKGAIVLSGDKTRGQAVATDEAGQASYLVRAMAITFAEGVERYFWYEFRSVEEDPNYSEDHFGLTHADMTPKPAFAAYRTFVAMRPAGSVQSPGPWHNEKRTIFFPQWTRPDGVKAGVIWKTGATEKRELRFASGGAGTPPAKITFRDYLGRPFLPERTNNGAYMVSVGENPVLFEGGELRF